ncbi:MAG: nucleotidyltransferase domain-containing protein [Ruminococcus sp.]|nr:nucleotidyltransferase domain-containing protein [Ruminococcus sp.]
MCSKSELQIILSEIAKTAKEVFDTKLDSVILYGSYARGDYNQDSDIDIMILVKEIAPDELWKFRAPVSKRASRLSLQYDVTVTPIIKDSETFYTYLDALPFYQNVNREGIRIGA